MPYAEYRSNMGVLRAMGNKQFPRRPAELSGHDTRSDMMWRILVVCWDHDPNIRPVAPAVLELVRTERAPGFCASHLIQHPPARVQATCDKQMTYSREPDSKRG